MIRQLTSYEASYHTQPRRKAVWSGHAIRSLTKRLPLRHAAGSTYMYMYLLHEYFTGNAEQAFSSCGRLQVPTAAILQTCSELYTLSVDSYSPCLTTQQVDLYRATRR